MRMNSARFGRRHKAWAFAAIAALGLLYAFTASPAFCQTPAPRPTQIHAAGPPLSWSAGYTLFLLEAPDLLTVTDARRHIEENGGTIALCSDSRVMTGWIAPEKSAGLIGSHGIVGVHFGPVGTDLVPPEDAFGRSLVGFFNSVATGQALQLELTERPDGDPLINDALEHPAVDPSEVIANLASKGMNWDDGLERAAANKGLNPGNSDTLLGTIAVSLMFIESDGSIDANLYTWTSAARDEVLNQVLSGASWWSSKAASYGKSATFQIYSYSPDQPAMSQGYEPITRASTNDSLWIGAVMSNLGYSGNAFSQVTAFNNWQKNSKATDWAYTCFFCYNPSGAPSRFTNNYFAYAYLGGPYIQMLYRNDGWAVTDIGKIFAHETGHIFWACDEYYQAGYGGCTSCNACTSFRPVMNGNCENTSCNPSGAVPCMMRGNSDALCPYTIAQIGWNTTQSVTIQAGTGGTTKPAPAAYNFPTGANLTVTALPNASYVFTNWTGGASGTANPLTIPNVTSSLTFRANFSVTVCAISGQVTAGGSPLAGVTITFSHDGHKETTNSGGAYTYSVPSGTTTTITPSLRGYGGWSPASRTLTSIGAPATGQDFAGTAMPWIDLGRASLKFGSVGGTTTKTQSVLISNGGIGTLSWTATPSAAWITASPANGTGRGAVEVGVNPAGFSPGTYSGSVAFAAPGAANSPQAVAISLTVYAAGSATLPFGYLDTPAEGTPGITGSLPVTGWVLDDIEATAVQIRRDPRPADPPAAIGADGKVFIGWATFVEGARTDVEAAYTSYPLNFRAGWGYMMLTNMLPAQGNGTYKIYAIARDKEGNSVTLGSKTFSCDNAHATKPFGTIDTPPQGGDASGAGYVNFGWALTPQAGTIPKSGSTIGVWVDGVLAGNLSVPPNVYNQYRSDVSTLFPGLNNTGGPSPGQGGPVGAFFLDTTAYANGVHSIAWSVTDDLDRVDGIGSRYFNIINVGTSPGTERRAGAPLSAEETARLRNAPSVSSGPVRIAKGFGREDAAEKLLPDGTGVFRMEIPQTGRIEVDFGGGEGGPTPRLEPSRTAFTGYLAVGEELRPLPVGSTLDSRTGRFTWMPGPAFLGTYDFAFFSGAGADIARIASVSVTITPPRHR